MARVVTTVSRFPARPQEVTGHWVAVLTACAAALGLGLSSAMLASGRHSALGVLLPLLLVPAAMWRWPAQTVLATLLGATVVEQFTYTAGPHKGAFTESIPLFRSLSSGSGVTPFEFLLLLAVIIWLMKGALNGTLSYPRTPLRRALKGLLLVVIVELAFGLARGGKFKIALWEVRPWVYMAVAFMLSCSLLQNRRLLRAIPWILVLGSGLKAILGSQIFLAIRKVRPRPEAVLAHEEAFFFGLFILLTLLLWIFKQRGALRRTATALLPIVVFADMVNSRRNAWAVLGLGLIAAMATSYKVLPDRRKMLRWVAAALLIVSAVYLPLYWNKEDSTLGQPARAVHSAIAPSARDKQSNLYRETEDEDLLLNIQGNKSEGAGFGIPINYAIPITNLTNLTSSISFIPHNGVLYVWLRLGVLGMGVFLYFIASAVIRAAKLAKSADKEFALLGTLVIAGIVGYLIQGYNDMGFFWFRIAIAMGILLGAVEAALRLREREDGSLPTRESAESLHLFEPLQPNPSSVGTIL